MQAASTCLRRCVRCVAMNMRRRAAMQGGLQSGLWQRRLGADRWRCPTCCCMGGREAAAQGFKPHRTGLPTCLVVLSSHMVVDDPAAMLLVCWADECLGESHSPRRSRADLSGWAATRSGCVTTAAVAPFTGDGVRKHRPQLSPPCHWHSVPTG